MSKPSIQLQFNLCSTQACEHEHNRKRKKFYVLHFSQMGTNQKWQHPLHVATAALEPTEWCNRAVVDALAKKQHKKSQIWPLIGWGLSVWNLCALPQFPIPLKVWAIATLSQCFCTLTSHLTRTTRFSHSHLLITIHNKGWVIWPWNQIVKWTLWLFCWSHDSVVLMLNTVLLSNTVSSPALLPLSVSSNSWASDSGLWTISDGDGFSCI